MRLTYIVTVATFAALAISACPAAAATASTLANLAATTLQDAQNSIRLDIDTGNPALAEVVSIRDKGAWVPALSSPHFVTRVVTEGSDKKAYACTLHQVSRIDAGLLLRGDCTVGSFEERIGTGTESGVLKVAMRFVVRPGVQILSVEDRYNFAPGRRSTDTPDSGPVDFVWSQNIKNEADDLIPNWAFKSPVAMMQQGTVFTALMPELSDRRPQPLGLDLDVTSDALPWLSYGAVASQPYGHSYFRRSPDQGPRIISNTIEYSYDIVASAQPVKQGYRTVVRRLWNHEGHHELLASNDLQQNVLRPELLTFDTWRTAAWNHYADKYYRGFDCGGQRCGTLVSNRNPWGQWDKPPAADAWFNAWFQTLRTAYGWYLYGEHTGNREIEKKAESILNLALQSPRQGGAFSTIYLLQGNQWVRSDHWAGLGGYRAFDMSWTAYWMLKWADDLTPNRRQEILAFVRPYGDFLVRQQLASGVIPSWYDRDLKPKTEFRDFNAGSTASSALLLAMLGKETGDRTYLDAAERAMEFVTREVLPRQRWFDFETFLSCARKPFDFYDKWTAQYPQNNLSQIQAAKAYLELFNVTKERKYLDQGTRVLDYLLLTQQVWNNPAFSPKMVGGFTTQNTDAEWSDARQSYAVVLLWDYYRATGRQEYLERSVAAARAGLAVVPWENWAHTGYIDEPGGFTGFHWGLGSDMTSIEMLLPTLGDAYIDVQNRTGVGFNACSLRHLRIENHRISFDLDAYPAGRSVHVRFAGLDPHASYRILWNGNRSPETSGAKLARDGMILHP